MRLSVVIPLYNEEEMIPSLIQRVKEACQPYKPFEVICINDGSTDNTLELLKKEKPSFPELKIVKFKKNAGQTDGFAAGFKVASGEIIVTLDGDLQNPPEAIPLLMEAIKDADVVSGWRYDRQDNIFRKFATFFANGFKLMFINDGIHDNSCALKAYRKNTVKDLIIFKRLHSFFPTLIFINGYRIKEIKVPHCKRMLGKSKYNVYGLAIPNFINLLGVKWMQLRKLDYEIEQIL